MSWNRAIVSTGNLAAVQSCCGTIKAGGCRKTNAHLSRVGTWPLRSEDGTITCSDLRIARQPIRACTVHGPSDAPRAACAGGVRRTLRRLRRWRRAGSGGCGRRSCRRNRTCAEISAQSSVRRRVTETLDARSCRRRRGSQHLAKAAAQASEARRRRLRRAPPMPPRSDLRRESVSAQSQPSPQRSVRR